MANISSELHHQSIHTSDVLEHGSWWIWRLLFLRINDDCKHRLRLVVSHFELKLHVTNETADNFRSLVPETKSIPLESMDRLFEIKPVRKANKIIIQQDRERDEEFRHDAEGAGLSVAKEKLDHVERTSERNSDA